MRGETIDGRWEICHDGTTWEDDLQITYRRTTGPSSSHSAAGASGFEVSDELEGS